MLVTWPAGRGPGGMPIPTPATVGEVVTAWLNAKSSRISPSTVSRYRVALRHILPAIGTIPVAEVRASDIEDLYEALVRRGLSGSSIRKVHWALRQSLAWAQRRGLVTSRVTDGVEMPPLGERPLQPPRSTDVSRLVTHALEFDPDFGLLIAFLAWTGARRGEACGLRWSDLDLAAESVLIERSIVAVPGGVLEKGTKTGRARRIALGPTTATLLRQHREACRQAAVHHGRDFDPESLVFSRDPLGRTAWHPSTISHRFVAACAAADVPPMRLHDLRHHSATALLKRGISVGEVMDRHGWRDLTMVSRYRHLTEATDRAAAVALETSAPASDVPLTP